MKYLIAIPACNKLDYGKWESTESPHFNPQNAYLGKGYGTNIHISGPNERIQAIRDTWAKDVPEEMCLKFFYGGLQSGDWLMTGVDEIMLPVEDDYAHLPYKVIEIFKWALAEGYDYVLKCDDDTMVWPKRALEEIRHKQWQYAGYMAHVGSYISGGPGYWLGRKAMEIVAGVTPYTWAEDMIVGETLARHHIKGYELNKTHLCGLANHWIDPSMDLSAAVTAHAVKAEDMRTIYARQHS
jgi:Galactosyltransferase